MPTRLLLEGPDIEVLLARVREEHGEQARIVQADKVRTGGIAGFFARQRYEVAIEVDEAVPALPTVTSLPMLPRPVVDAPATILDLIEDIDSFERTPTRTDADIRGHDDTSDPLSTSTDEFARVLARLTHDVSDGVAQETPVIRAFSPPRIPAARVEAREMTPTEQQDFEPARFETISLPDASTYRPKLNSPIADLSIVDLAPEVRPAPLVEPVVAPAALVESPLVRLGVPVALAPSVAADEVLNTHAALARFVARLPEPPRPLKGAGQVTVVVGENAYAAAQQVARRARIDPDEVLLAAPATASAGTHCRRDIAGPVHARRRIADIREADTAVVIAVDAAPGRDNDEWTRKVIAALAPDAVWVVVDATRKTDDVMHHIARLGHVDALVVERTEETADPASVLQLGIPVAQLDGRRATASAWSVLLGERLAAAARTDTADGGER